MFWLTLVESCLALNICRASGDTPGPLTGDLPTPVAADADSLKNAANVAKFCVPLALLNVAAIAVSAVYRLLSVQVVFETVKSHPLAPAVNPVPVVGNAKLDVQAPNADSSPG